MTSRRSSFCSTSIEQSALQSVRVHTPAEPESHGCLFELDRFGSDHVAVGVQIFS